jgi:hypothetical protein
MKTEYYKDSLGQKITVYYFKANAQYEIEGKNVKHVVTLNTLDIKKKSNRWKLISGDK